jgi:predicted nuclease of predicted toxin-antitoxin system
VRLLLDEMISPKIAGDLRERGHDVQAVKKDRPDLTGCADLELVQRMARERRAIVTNDIADFQPIHNRMLVAGEEHARMVFTFDATLPRTKAAIPQWIDALAKLLAEQPLEGSLRNRVLHLP